MISVLARESRAVWLLSIAALCGTLALPAGGVLLSVPLVPRGMPAGWVAAIASAVLLVVALRPSWDASVLGLVRTPAMNAARFAVACLVAAIAYLPWMGHAEPAEIVGWCVLIAAAILASAALGEHAWVAVVLIGIALEVANNAGHREVAHAATDYASIIVAVAACSGAVGAAAVLARMRTTRWYREAD